MLKQNIKNISVTKQQIYLSEVQSTRDAELRNQGFGGSVPKECKNFPSRNRYPFLRPMTAVIIFFRHCFK